MIKVDEITESKKIMSFKFGMSPFPGIQKGNKSLEMEEERRNCFVAITRAIKTLTRSYVQIQGMAQKTFSISYGMGLL